MPATFKVWPCDLLIVIENATFNGNCRRLKLNGKLLGMIGMRGIRTLSPLASWKVEIQKSTTRELEESKPKLLDHSFKGGQFAILSDVMTMRLTFCPSCLSAR
ncbi:hypothetical protein TNCV_5110941 [Trichonephila clavipes]|nr:hypothetical protein TNCV_5110941 [Trichonephila clavipes]